MSEFKINFGELDGIISNMNLAIKNIDPAAPGMHTPTQCQGTVLSDYVNRMDKISKLLTKYRELLEKDVEDIKKSRRTLAEMDTKITVNFKK